MVGSTALFPWVHTKWFENVGSKLLLILLDRYLKKKISGDSQTKVFVKKHYVMELQLSFNCAPQLLFRPFLMETTNPNWSTNVTSRKLLQNNKLAGNARLKLAIDELADIRQWACHPT